MSQSATHERIAGVAQSDEAKCRQSILETFRLYDRNGDGIISRDEMVEVLTRLDTSGCFHIDRVDSLLAAMDRNDDGLVDTEEFVDWAMSSGACPTKLLGTEALLEQLVATHIFILPQVEASLERCTLWEERREENNMILADIGMGPLNDPALLVMSVGSSSTQIYDAQDFAVSFPIGTKVRSAQVYKELTTALIQRSVPYSRVLLLNSIGYQLSATDPRCFPLSELAARAAGNEAGALPTTVDLHEALVAALPDATMYVYNRAKDPATKRYKYVQVGNDFTDALISAHGLSLCSRSNSKVSAKALEVQDAIVDWGGGSFKVYANGKRIGTELMDANALLCKGDVLNKERLAEAIRHIKLFVLHLLPDARRIFIGQTGKARELAIRDKLSFVE